MLKQATRIKKDEVIIMKTNERTWNEEEEVIDLRDLFFALKRKIFLILAISLLGGCLSGVFTAFFIKPVYTSTSSVLVLSKETTLTSIADLQLGSQLAKDYQVLIQSTEVMKQAIDSVKEKYTEAGIYEDFDMTPDELRKCITINNPSDTRILEISVEHNEPVVARDLVNAVTSISSSYVGNKMEVIPPKVIEEGKLPIIKTSPSMVKNVLVGFMIGLMLSAGVVVLLTIMDDSIKSEEDVEKYLEIPVLASVPDRKDFINTKKMKKEASRRSQHQEISGGIRK